MAITGKAISELTLATSLSTGSYFPVVDPTLLAGSKNVRVTVDGLSKNLVNVAYLTGNQTISGAKTFSSRPTVNGSGVLLSGEATSATISNVVYQTGDQTVSGVKTFVGTGYFLTGLIVSGNGLRVSGAASFSQRPTVNGTGVLLSGEATSATISNVVYQTGDQTVSGVKTFVGTGYFLSGLIVSGSGLRVSGAASFSQRPTVNGTGVLLSGEATSATISNVVYQTGDQTVSGVKTFVGTGYFLSGLIVSGSGLRVSGAASFSQRPTVNGTGVLLSGESSYNVSGEIWITNRTDGFSGNGLISSPYDGSTAQKLSGIFKAYEGKDVNINFFPGKYYTYPTYLHNNFSWKPGAWNIKGAGMDKTTIVVTGVTGAGRSCAFVNDFSSTNAEIKPMTVQDLTIDGGGYVSGACVSAVSIYNSNALISRVRATNCGTSDKTLECFPLQITPLYSAPQALKNNVIEDSIVINPWSGTSSMTAIIISQIENTGVGNSIYNSDFSGNANLSNIIRGCYVDLNSHSGNINSVANDGTGNNFIRQAFTAPMVENNYCQNVTHGIYQDTWNYNRNVYRNNSIINTRFAIAINLSGSYSGDSALIENNIVELSNYTGYSYFVGIQFQTDYVPTGRFKHVDISKNKIYVRSGKPFSGADYYGINAYGGIQNLTITDNILPDFASLGLGANSKTINPDAIQMRVYNNLSTGLSLLPEINPPYVSTIGNQTISGVKTFVGTGYFLSGLIVNGSLTVTGHFSANTKSFLIDHPTIPGKKLQYGVTEGPEHSVFIRGKLINDSFISFPHYWSGLVDLSSITVSLTPIGTFQNLYVNDVNISGVKVTSDALDTNCYYHVFAERKDVPKLEVEV